ncbi:MAG TPA: hypothetical protein VGB84_00240 [Arachidicoccus sp.]
MENMLILLESFSPDSLDITLHAAQTALTINANIILLHIYQSSLNYDTYREEEKKAAFHKEKLSKEKQIKEFRDYLDLRVRSKIHISTHIINGNFIDALNTFISRTALHSIVLPVEDNINIDTLRMHLSALIQFPPSSFFIVSKNTSNILTFLTNDTPMEYLKITDMENVATNNYDKKTLPILRAIQPATIEYKIVNGKIKHRNRYLYHLSQ